MDKEKADNQPHYSGHRKRLKDKFDNTPSALADYEILELILGYVIPRRDVKPIAKEILRINGSMADIFSVNKLHGIKGIGSETERFFKVLTEFYDRIEKSSLKKHQTLSSPEKVYKFLKYSMAYAEDEKFAAIFLDSKNRVLKTEILSEGIVNKTIVYPRKVAEHALKYKASNVIIAHNHPTGDSTPSNKDIEITKLISESLDTLDIKLVDHVIVCKTEYTSLQDLGYIF